jgi:hypothetical protein
MNARSADLNTPRPDDYEIMLPLISKLFIFLTEELKSNRRSIMRKSFLLIAALFLMAASSNLNAQVSVGVRINLDSQPAWGPTGYDYVEYYYLPDIDVYYSVPLHRYYYFHRGRWIWGSSLPSRYRQYNVYNSFKVVANEREPWRRAKFYRDKYSPYKGRHDQQIIRDSRDPKYFANKNHPEHRNWLKQQKQDNRKQDQGRKKESRRRSKVRR